MVARMKTRLFLGALLVGFPTALATGVLGAGCGGSSDDSASNADASQDVTAKDTATQDVVQIVDAGRCDDADLNTLSLPDAALGDSGASVGTCLDCTRGSCETQISACNASCQCKNDIDDALNCIAQQGGLNASCAGGLLSGGDVPAQNLGQCLYLSCQNECGLGGFNFGDAGDGGDGG